MCSVEGLREFINARLSAAAVEIYQTIAQYQEEVDAQLLDISWRGETKTTEQHVWKEKMSSTFDQETPEPTQTKGDQVQLVVKQEADAFMVTVVDEKNEHGENLIRHDSIRKFIMGRLTAAAIEIFTVFENNIVQCQETVESQRRQLEISWNEETKLNTTDDPQQQPCKEEQLCDQEINYNLDQKEPKSPQIKEDLQEFCIRKKEEQLELKQETETFMVTVPEQSIHRESKPDDELFLLHNSAVDESQSQTEDHHEDSGLTGFADLNKKYLSHNMDTSPTLENQCETEPDKKCLTCGFCGKTFNFFSQIEVHNRTHTGERPFSCETCGKSYRRRSHLLSHKKSHTGEKPFSCETCGKSFSQPDILSTHRRTHTGEKPYSCETCGKCFSRKDKLMYHEGSHTGDKPYSCETCGKCFRVQRNMLAHVRTHTGEKAYGCEKCGKSFSQPSHLFKHKKTHTGEKPHICETCGKSFRQESFLLNHMRIHINEKPFSCKICGKGFSRQSSLPVHMRIHTGEKPYSCVTCGKNFNRNSNLLVHMKTHDRELLKS